MQQEKDMRPPFLPLAEEAPGRWFAGVPTPAYVIDAAQLQKNGGILAQVAAATGAKILLAQKAFSNFAFYPLLAPYLAGTEASGLFEARLGREEMPGKEVHVFCAAYRDDEMPPLLEVADHIVFNSVAQLKKFGPAAKSAGKSLGLRINPECSTQEGHAIYDPCAPGSRLGVTRAAWDAQMDAETLSLLDGLHFHTLCEQNADALETTLHAVQEKFGDVLPRMQWLNLGGGHHITRPDYDRAQLCRCIRFAQQQWDVQVYLEPGEAVALNAGFLCTKVLDIVENGGVKIAILDASAACHMPDVIEMPYTPPLYGAQPAPEADAAHTQAYRLAGPTCLSGDVVGDFAFDHPLQIGELLVFGDMAIYTTCKNNTFNGMPLPNIWARNPAGGYEALTDFGYQDFKGRLG